MIPVKCEKICLVFATVYARGRRNPDKNEELID
jgi:hypothetical protein